MPIERLGFVKTLGTLELFTKQTHFYEIRLRSFASVDPPSIFLTINPCTPCLITCANFSKLGYFPHPSSLKLSQGPRLFGISDTSS